jgi:osmotically-inducible protein OsmY
MRQLSWDSRVNASNVIVEVIDHTAILSGIVGSYMQRKAAETDTMSIEGITEVKNHLQILRSDGLKGPTDSEIESNIRTILTLNAIFDTSKIDVSVSKGTVSLTGTVDEYWKKLQAEETIFDVHGVYNVINTLSVVTTSVPYDEEIAKNILTMLSKIPNINLQSINVEVSGGRVRIRGSVANWHVYTAAHNAIKYTRGVTDLTNMLVIV